MFANDSTFINLHYSKEKHSTNSHPFFPRSLQLPDHRNWQNEYRNIRESVSQSCDVVKWYNLHAVHGIVVFELCPYNRDGSALEECSDQESNGPADKKCDVSISNQAESPLNKNPAIKEDNGELG